MSSRETIPQPDERQAVLKARRNVKMARSAHAYVRGSTRQFYAWLESNAGRMVPNGPPIWICGDCHLGNLGPIADANGRVAIQIRDLDQTVIGNPAHDLIRLGLSLASAARGSDLPGVITATMLEHMIEGYAQAFEHLGQHPEEEMEWPQAVQAALKRAPKRRWKHLATERIDDAKPGIPLGSHFWPLSRQEKAAIKELFAQEDVRRLVTSLRSRDDNAPIKILDAAYWRKGCSSLGNLRYAVVIGIGKPPYKQDALCLMDIKEAVHAAAPRTAKKRMPRDNAERVVKGAQHLAPFLGKRMLATHMLGRSVFLRELLPQDLTLDIEQLTKEESIKVAQFLAMVVGIAHARQMDSQTRQHWLDTLKSSHSKTLEAPSWLWSSIVELMASHEAAYLEHCRAYAMAVAKAG